MRTSDAAMMTAVPVLDHVVRLAEVLRRAGVAVSTADVVDASQARADWEVDDSTIGAYAAHCDGVFGVSTVRMLAHVVGELV